MTTDCLWKSLDSFELAIPQTLMAMANKHIIVSLAPALYFIMLQLARYYTMESLNEGHNNLLRRIIANSISCPITGGSTTS